MLRVVDKSALDPPSQHNRIRGHVDSCSHVSQTMEALKFPSTYVTYLDSVVFGSVMAKIS